MSIGRSPFRKITSHKRVTFDAGDWLGHLSNSSSVPLPLCAKSLHSGEVVNMATNI